MGVYLNELVLLKVNEYAESPGVFLENELSDENMHVEGLGEEEETILGRDAGRNRAIDGGEHGGTYKYYRAQYYSYNGIS